MTRLTTMMLVLAACSGSRSSSDSHPCGDDVTCRRLSICFCDGVSDCDEICAQTMPAECTLWEGTAAEQVSVTSADCDACRDLKPGFQTDTYCDFPTPCPDGCPSDRCCATEHDCLGDGDACHEGCCTTFVGPPGGSDAGCPDVPPAQGDSCQPESYCSWGDDPRVPDCRTQARCEYDLDGWQTSVPDCDPLPTAGCPATEAEAEGECTDAGSVCLFETGAICACNDTWVCAPAPGDGCPPIAPNEGAPCQPDGLECSYGGCELSEAMNLGETFHTCSNGVWGPPAQALVGPCDF